MKIGILTLPILTNYGGILQAYALLKTLQNMGHDAWLINKRTAPIGYSRYYIRRLKKYFKNLILGSCDRVVSDKERVQNEKIISKHTQRFIDKHIQPQTLKYYTSRDLKRVNEYYFDAYIVGSDQVWRPEYTSCIYDYFLSFLDKRKKSKKIAYAPSFGVDYWPYSREETEKCKKLLRDFHAVSVREIEGVNMCQEYFDLDACHVLDPTMLLERKDYLDLLDVNNDSNLNKSPEGMLTYILGKEKYKSSIIEYMSKLLNLTAFPVNSETEDYCAEVSSRIAPPVENWLKGFENAEFVVTDSFHGCVFSIIFNKPFVAIGNKDRGLSRFTSLLSTFELENRLVMDPDFGRISSLVKEHIDWDNTNKILEIKREEAISFLTQSLL